MNEDKIIKLWKQGYTVEQITDMSIMVQKTKRKDKEKSARCYVKNLVENAILKYQSKK